jgi:uncharacterized protein
MYRIFLFVAFAFFLTVESLSQNTNIDTALIRKLGADDYGMKKYVMAFLLEGPNSNNLPAEETAKLQKGHMDNIWRMSEMGKLLIAGPFMDQGKIRGIYIFNAEGVEEAKALTESDPAVKAGIFIMELHPWYGSAALMMAYEVHKKIQVKKF